MKRAGEFELIDAFVGELPHPHAPRGPGDDTAVLPSGRGKLCVTTDAVVEGVHFSLPKFSLADVGHKALAVNLSDLAAMGARPTWWLCALGLPPRFGRTQVVALAGGMAPLARRYRLELVGGNVTASPVLTVTLTLAGEATRPLLRSGAKRSDLLYVSGVLGAAAAGLSDPDASPSLVRAQRRPTPQVELGLAAAPFASAAIDVSDGLLGDLQHLCDASGCGANVESGLLPLPPSATAARALERALSGGEDYQLLLAIPPRKAAAFERASRGLGVRVTRIGAMRSRRGLTLDGAPGPALGFNHFRPR